MQTNTKNFASDNNSGVHPEVLEALAKVNVGHVHGYGEDEYTARAIDYFKEHFGENIEVYFVSTGTAANVLGMKALTRSYNAIICVERSHLNEHECCAPENYTGCKLITIESGNGKLTVDMIRPRIVGIGDEHYAQPAIISITQASELGTVYTPAEIRVLADFAHDNGMRLHMDGARLSNAAVHLGFGFKEITRDVGVDVLSFGGTKNGLMCGEAVIFFNKDFAKDFKYIRKQGMQLTSKMRFLSAQFIAFFRNELWKRNAEHSNRMARLLASEAGEIPGIEITQPVQANAVFARIPGEIIQPLQKEYFFYPWDEKQSLVRWMTSFDTTEEDVAGFVKTMKQLLT